MRRIRWLLFAILSVTTLSLSAQECDEASGCAQLGGIQITINLPTLLDEYPQAQAVILEDVREQRHAYLAELLEFSGVLLERTLVFEIDYEVSQFGDTLITILLRAYYDVGGLYPLDSLRSYTIATATDRLLTIDDLFADDVDVVATLRPYIVAEYGEMAETFVYNDETLSALESYRLFTVSEDDLTLLFPSGRSGPTHAGAFPVIIPLSELDELLNETYFG